MGQCVEIELGSGRVDGTLQEERNGAQDLLCRFGAHDRYDDSFLLAGNDDRRVVARHGGLRGFYEGNDAGGDDPIIADGRRRVARRNPRGFYTGCRAFAARRSA